MPLAGRGGSPGRPRHASPNRVSAGQAGPPMRPRCASPKAALAVWAAPPSCLAMSRRKPPLLGGRVLWSAFVRPRRPRHCWARRATGATRSHEAALDERAGPLARVDDDDDGTRLARHAWHCTSLEVCTCLRACVALYRAELHAMCLPCARSACSGSSGGSQPRAERWTSCQGCHLLLMSGSAQHLSRWGCPSLVFGGGFRLRPLDQAHQCVIPGALRCGLQHLPACVEEQANFRRATFARLPNALVCARPQDSQRTPCLSLTSPARTDRK